MRVRFPGSDYIWEVCGMTETCWVAVTSGDLNFGTLVFVPMLETDREALLMALMEDGLDGTDERMTATHFAIQNVYPDEEDADTQEERDELTWHDLSIFPAKMVDGAWHVWYEDVGSTGTVWYQSTYTRAEAEGTRDIAIRLASEGRLYRDLYDVARSELMTDWT